MNIYKIEINYYHACLKIIPNRKDAYTIYKKVKENDYFVQNSRLSTNKSKSFNIGNMQTGIEERKKNNQISTLNSLQNHYSYPISEEKVFTFSKKRPSPILYGASIILYEKKVEEKKHNVNIMYTHI